MQLPRTVDHRSVAWLNALDDAQATVELRTCCAADAWVRGILDQRPFPCRDDLLATSDALVAGLDDEGFDQALGAHARIGERRAGESREDT
ncbi:MAG: 2-oxo-4-hydroxy-4-carboxy-5-ureidoimidazoline decarboxylase, partial [Nocardioidaceae bacterium]